MKNENVIVNKSMDFAVRIVNLYKYLTKEKSEYILSKQLLRSGTSIGANVNEAVHAQSSADFVAKMHIALKESGETEYWIKLLEKTDYLSKIQADSIGQDCQELIKILVSIIKTTKQNNS
ncbi:MAG: four helix bundle protein [Selenomonadaceae bacterium]|nr:four helix bundle protein [Selenomonadaceae bacterium]